MRVALKHDIVPALSDDDAIAHHDRAIRLITFLHPAFLARARALRDQAVIVVDCGTWLERERRTGGASSACGWRYMGRQYEVPQWLNMIETGVYYSLAHTRDVVRIIRSKEFGDINISTLLLMIAGLVVLAKL